MPSKSRAQQRLMFAAAKDKKLRKSKGIPDSVVKEYVSADKARGPKKLPERVTKPAPKAKPKAPRAPTNTPAAREFRLRNAKL